MMRGLLVVLCPIALGAFELPEVRSKARKSSNVVLRGGAAADFAGALDFQLFNNNFF